MSNVRYRSVFTASELRDIEIKAKLLGSFLLFTRTFFKLLNNREFLIPAPTSRENHVHIICRELTKVFKLETLRLLINLPPGHFKSTLCTYFVAWTLAHYPDSNFLYLSYGLSEAAKNTSIIRQIMSHAEYKKTFGVCLDDSSNARDNFKTNFGGSVKAFGLSGGITGKDAGLPNLNRFSGGILIDDAHKPDDVHSDLKREGVITNYSRTVLPRLRGINVPIIFLGQRVHEADLAAYLLKEIDSQGDGEEWKKIILEAHDMHENVLCPEVITHEKLCIKRELTPYEYWSQYQQKPTPSGGTLFKPEYFKLLDDYPTILETFITVDSAETEKSYNDATVFSFWGVYKINDGIENTDRLALHWIDCVEIRVEPKDLYDEFLAFYQNCLRFKVRPYFAAIEKKSTGVTLYSVLKEFRGLQIKPIERKGWEGKGNDKHINSKTARYLSMQKYIAAKLISLPTEANHTKMCIDHMVKITANQTHRFDDICDTAYDAIKVALMDKWVYPERKEKHTDSVLQGLASNTINLNQLKDRAYYGR